MYLKLEFKAGDLVTFQPYEIAILALVVKSETDRDGLPEYTLEGLSHSLITRTDGTSIQESRHWEEPEEGKLPSPEIVKLSSYDYRTRKEVRLKYPKAKAIRDPGYLFLGWIVIL